MAFLLALGISGICFGQNCTNPGQTPVSAIYVCGTDVFTHQTEQFCGQTAIPVSCGPGFNYANRNPTYYRFACYNSGTLGLIITPLDAAADINWQLFDITSTNPVDIFTNPSMSVAGNWSPEPGVTGASSDGTASLVCFSPGANPFSTMPPIVGGRSYMLMVSNESATTGGFSIHFTGGTASITDPDEPGLRDAAVNCDRSSVRVRFNKSLLCQTIAFDGSDFDIPGALITAAIPWDCSSVFGTEVVTLLLAQPLAVGNHQVRVRTGTDGNTVKDICNRSVRVDETVSFVSGTLLPTPMDQVLFKPCSPDYIELVFSRKILCNSLAADGSDFIITGPQNLVPAIAPCSGSSNIIQLSLPAGAQPGTYQVQLAQGTDGNTIIDECGMETPAGAVLSFTLSRGVSAAFTKAGQTGCGAASIQFAHDGANGVNTWDWDFGAAGQSNLQFPLVNFPNGSHAVRLVVSNGSCRDTASELVTVSKSLRAWFSLPPELCGGESLQVENQSTGSATSWLWDFGNGQVSVLKDPPPILFAPSAGDAYYTVKLIVTDNAGGCSDTVRQGFRLVGNCGFEVPTAFSPNGDGLNDLFSPLRPLRAQSMIFEVYDRRGFLLFRSRKWDQRWDGKVNGVNQPTGVYVWVFRYTDETGRAHTKSGTVLLLR